ncbi:MAG: hypothetical protein V5A43_00435 [Haloarculaceae archaeon]
MTIVGLVAIAGLYWSGVSLLIVVTVLVLILPVYLLIAAALINSWLGYGGTAIPLTRVTEEGSARSTASFPTQEAPRENRPRSRVGSVLQRSAENPRFYLALITSAVASGLIASLFGRDGITFFSFAFGFMATIIALQTFLWNRLKRTFERRAENRSADRLQPIGGRSAEAKAGIIVAFVVMALLVLAIAVFRALVA